MSWQLNCAWQPTQLMEVGESYRTSNGVTEVTTDVGCAFVKALGNSQGPHVLACDWVATHLAHWFGLTTFEVAILYLNDSDCFPLPGGATVEAGSAFAARAVEGHPWGRLGAE